MTSIFRNPMPMVKVMKSSRDIKSCRKCIKWRYVTRASWCKFAFTKECPKEQSHG